MQTIHVTGNGVFRPRSDTPQGINGQYMVHFSGDFGGGTATLQLRLTETDPQGNTVNFANFVRIFAGAGQQPADILLQADEDEVFFIQATGQVAISMSGSSDPNLYVFFKQLETSKL